MNQLAKINSEIITHVAFKNELSTKDATLQVELLNGAKIEMYNDHELSVKFKHVLIWLYTFLGHSIKSEDELMVMYVDLTKICKKEYKHVTFEGIKWAIESGYRGFLGVETPMFANLQSIYKCISYYMLNQRVVALKVRYDTQKIQEDKCLENINYSEDELDIKRAKLTIEMYNLFCESDVTLGEKIMYTYLDKAKIIAFDVDLKKRLFEEQKQKLMQIALNPIEYSEFKNSRSLLEAYEKKPETLEDAAKDMCYKILIRQTFKEWKETKKALSLVHGVLILS